MMGERYVINFDNLEVIFKESRIVLKFKNNLTGEFVEEYAVLWIIFSYLSEAKVDLHKLKLILICENLESENQILNLGGVLLDSLDNNSTRVEYVLKPIEDRKVLNPVAFKKKFLIFELEKPLKEILDCKTAQITLENLSKVIKNHNN